MPLENWELSFCPNDKDKNRWRLKLKISETELAAVVGELPGTLGRPFLLEDETFDFGLYFYNVNDEELAEIKKDLASLKPGGAVIGPSKEEALDALLERVAKGLDNLWNPAAVPEAPVQKNINEDDILQDIRQSLKKTKETSSISEKEEEIEAPKKKPADNLDSIINELDKVNEVIDQSPVVQNIPEPVQAKQVDIKPESIMPEPPAEIKADPVPEKEPAPKRIINMEDDARFQPLRLNPRYIFEEFVIGPNNRFTAAAAQAVADNPGKIYNPFFIYSGVGLGKTHLMHAVGHYVRKKNPDLKVVYLTTEKFMGEVIDSIRQGNLTQMRDYYRQADLLLVDDIQFLVESESTQEEFFHTFNVLHQNGKQIIITSDRPPKHLTTLEDRLRSRFEWGLIADIKAPNLETRVAILKKKGEVEKLQLSDNILLYIASKLKSNIRELEGFLKRINAYAQLTHHQVDMELVKSLMSDLLPLDEQDSAQTEQAQLLAQLEKQRTATSNIDINAIPMANIPSQSQPAGSSPQQNTPVDNTQSNQPNFVPEKERSVQSPGVQPQTPQFFEMPAAHQGESEEKGVKSVDVAFFYPSGKLPELAVAKTHFNDVIKKHKLKFKLNSVIENDYSCSGRINYTQFSDTCKDKKLAIAIVIGPPPDSNIESDDFANLLTTVMEDEGISLQFIPWSELNKDYRYLNLSLDITLLKRSK